MKGKNLLACMWFDRHIPGCGGFTTKPFPGCMTDDNLSGFPPLLNSLSNASLEAKLFRPNVTSKLIFHYKTSTTAIFSSLT